MDKEDNQVEYITIIRCVVIESLSCCRFFCSIDIVIVMAGLNIGVDICFLLKLEGAEVIFSYCKFYNFA